MFSGVACAAVFAAVLEPALAHRIALEDDEHHRIALEQAPGDDCLQVSQVRIYCPIGMHPGACYNSTDVGVVQCYSESDGTDGPAECSPGHDMKCSYSNYGVILDESDIPSCTGNGVTECEAQCQLLNNHWGACYANGNDVPRGDRCRCVPKDDSVTVEAMHQADHCLTRRIGSSYRTYDGVCRYPTDTSSFDLQECLDVPSFPGKCPIEHNPGACYRENGGWMCWAGEQWFTDRECREVHGFDGACTYRSFGERLQEADIQQCQDVGRQVCENCDPVLQWGGCYEENHPEHDCLCAPRADPAFIERMEMNSCRTQKVEGTARAYSGVCRLPTPPETPEERPECLDIATFHGQCPISEYQGACYREDVGDWRCWTEEDPLTPFDCRLSRDDSGHTAGFDGSCEFKDFGQLQDEADLPLCLALDKCMSHCEPVRNNWGACYPPDDVPDSVSSPCLCAPRVAIELIETDLLRQHSCDTKKIEGVDIAYEGLCRFPEDISELNLEECLEMPHHAAKCSIESSPGACYSTDETMPWSCWSAGTFFAGGECMSRNFAGACKWGLHNHTIAAEDIHECHMITTREHQGGIPSLGGANPGQRCAECDHELHNLACYQVVGDMDSECYCAPKGDRVIEASMLAHSCETREVEESPGLAYTFLCRVPELADIPTAPTAAPPADPVYRCEGVPTYTMGDNTVDCPMQSMRAACFSATESGWQCHAEENREERCSASGNFDGSCVYNGAAAWANASVWVVEEEVVTHGRRRRTPVPSPNGAPRAGPLASILLSALAAAATGAGRF